MIRKSLSILTLMAAAAAPSVAQDKGHTPPPKPHSPPAKGSETPGAKPGEGKAAEAGAKPFGVGSEADASISLPDEHGKSHSLKDYRGKVVVIDFWSMDEASAAYDKRLAQIADDVAKKGGVFLAIDSSKADADSADPEHMKAVQESAQKSGLHFPILIDKGGSVAHRLGAKTTNQVLVLDAKGIVKYSGAIDDDPKGDKGDKATHYLRDAVDAVMAGKDVAKATTTATGTPLTRELPKAEKKDKEPKK